MNEVGRARRSLLVFFAVLIPLSGVFEWMSIHRIRIIERPYLGILLMWSPACASLVARLALREGVRDVSFRLGGAKGLRAIGYALLFPLGALTISYGLAWATGLASFVAPTKSFLMIPRSVITLTGDPIVRLTKDIGLHVTVGILSGAMWAAGEEIGWRGYLVQRMLDARIPCALPLSGLVWAVWHWPLILFSPVYVTGPSRVLGVILFTVLIVPVGAMMGRLRLETGSVWAPIVLHAAWNEILGVFMGATKDEGIWVGETGILTAAVSIALMLPKLRGVWRDPQPVPSPG